MRLLSPSEKRFINIEYDNTFQWIPLSKPSEPYFISTCLRVMSGFFCEFDEIGGYTGGIQAIKFPDT